jgi:hypothetical protein
VFDFLSIKNSVEAIRERYHALDRELQALRSEVIAVRDARINRADIAVLVGEWIKRKAAGFDEAVLARAQRQLQGSGAAHTIFNVGFVGLASADPDSPDAKGMDTVMCAVFGSDIYTHMLRALQDMHWPDEGLRSADRTKKLGQLADREKTVRADMEKIIKDAADAGIDL